MTKLTTTCLGLALVFSSLGASAQDTVKKDGTAKDSGTTMAMTMQQCKEHMAVSEKAGVKKDEAMMKKDTMCNELMNKGGGMTKGGVAGEPMKK